MWEYGVPLARDPNKWIRINLIDNYMVTGIIVQGPGELHSHWVMTCKVKYERMVGAGDLVYITEAGGNDKLVKANKPYTLHND